MGKYSKYADNPTPQELANAICNYYKDRILQSRKILDPGAGTGIWGNAIKKVSSESHIEGVEIKNIKHKNNYNSWYNKTDFIVWADEVNYRYDFIIGNPPYGTIKYHDSIIRFIKSGISLLTTNGILIYLLRQAVRSSKNRYNNLWSIGYAPSIVIDLVQRPKFAKKTSDIKTEYALFVWDYNIGWGKRPYLSDWLSWR